jgi:hypothetical protein
MVKGDERKRSFERKLVKEKRSGGDEGRTTSFGDRKIDRKERRIWWGAC